MDSNIQRNENPSSSERKPCEPSILSPTKTPFKNEGKIEVFSDKAGRVHPDQICTIRNAIGSSLGLREMTPDATPVLQEGKTSIRKHKYSNIQVNRKELFLSILIYVPINACISILGIGSLGPTCTHCYI